MECPKVANQNDKIEQEVKVLKALKAEYKLATGQEWEQAALPVDLDQSDSFLQLSLNEEEVLLQEEGREDSNFVKR